MRSSKPLYRYLNDLEAGFPASPPERWVFASVGAHRGSEQAKKLEQAAQGRDTSTLRLVTLRIGSRKPTADELAGHLKLLSDAASSCSDYLAGHGLAHPILSAIQIRRDRAVEGSGTVLDPHVHGIWEVSQGAIDRVRRYLDDRFASVWIDDIPVRDLKAAAFYVISGMLDYRDVPSWPDDAIEAVWALPRMRMIRPAGWFADPSRANGPKIGLEARQRGPKQDLRGSTQRDPKTDQRAANAAKERRSPSGRQRLADGRSTTSTVRALASESVNLGRTPTLSELWFVGHVIRERLQGKPPSAFRDLCQTFDIPLSEAYEAVRVTEPLSRHLCSTRETSGCRPRLPLSSCVDAFPR